MSDVVMTDEKRSLGRRNFLKVVATLPVAGAVAWQARAMQPVRAAIIGSGGQGRTLIENSPASHVRYAAVCDIEPGNRQAGLDLARALHDPAAEADEDYRRVLERKDIEAVVIATPLWCHEAMTIDALAAGKHVFCEKALAKTNAGCRRMVDASLSSRRVLQVGHQRAYNPQYHQAKAVIDAGTIGEVHHVRCVWHRNGDWRRPVPATGFDPSPWGYPTLEHLKNWRLYSTFSNGLMAELASHQLHVVDWFFDTRPVAVYGVGGIHRYKDGREVDDHVYLIYEYPGDLTVTYSSVQSNAFEHYYEEFMGTKGTLILTGENDVLLFMEGDGTKASTITVEPVGSGPLLQASESRARDAAGGAVSGGTVGGNSVSAYRLEIEGFASTIRTGAPNLCDGAAGMNADVGVIFGEEAMRRRARVEIPATAFYGTANRATSLGRRAIDRDPDARARRAEGLG